MDGPVREVKHLENGRVKKSNTCRYAWCPQCGEKADLKVIETPEKLEGSIYWYRCRECGKLFGLSRILPDGHYYVQPLKRKIAMRAIG